jgi:uncharacterized protein YjbJ (UPF0337 family)
MSGTTDKIKGRTKEAVGVVTGNRRPKGGDGPDYRQGQEDGTARD